MVLFRSALAKLCTTQRRQRVFFRLDFILNKSKPHRREFVSSQTNYHVSMFAFRKFATGVKLEQMLHTGSADIIDLILKEDGKPFDALKYTTLLVYNTIGKMVFSKT